MYPAVGSTSYAPHQTQDPGRQQQVAELRQQLPGVEALNRDASLYEVPMRLRDGHNTRLRISLPPGFPEARPGLSVTHPIRHPAVDPSGRVSSQGLQQWSPQSSLAAVVVETISLLTGAAPPTQAHLASPSGAAEGGQPVRPSASASPLPSVPLSFPALQHATTESLHLALVDDREYRSLVEQEAAKLDVFGVQRQLREGNCELAAVNLSRESELGELRNQIAIVRSSEYAVAKEAFDELVARQEKVLSKLNPKVLSSGLAAAAEDADTAASDLYAAFTERQEMGLEAFVQQHVQLRKKYHALELKRQAAEQTRL